MDRSSSAAYFGAGDTFSRRRGSSLDDVGSHAPQVERASMTATPTLEERALAGDRDAWQALIARHERPVLLSLLARGLRVDRARELMQETLAAADRAAAARQTSAPRAAGAGDRAGAVPRARASASAADRGRRRRRDRARRLRDAGTRALLAGAARPCPVRARGMFALVPARLRLVYEQPQLRHQEVAERVGLSLQRVRQILCETRKVLREALEEQS